MRNFTAHKTKLNGITIHYCFAGSGDPIVLLHGYPQTHYIWHQLAPTLSTKYTVVLPDLRGYGDSDKPAPLPDHSNYSKRRTAQDIVQLMAHLGFEKFILVGHDRGARVAHRLTLDHQEKVIKLILLDIIPTYDIFFATNKEIAMHHYHWFFLSQPPELPEVLIQNSAEYYLSETLKRWCKTKNAITQEAFQEYLRCFKLPGTIKAACEDYRAAITIDLEHDEADRNKLIECPLLVLWGKQGAMEAHFDVLEIWRKRASNVTGKSLSCGHFLPEEAPDDVLSQIEKFLLK